MSKPTHTPFEKKTFFEGWDVEYLSAIWNPEPVQQRQAQMAQHIIECHKRTDLVDDMREALECQNDIRFAYPNAPIQEPLRQKWEARYHELFPERRFRNMSDLCLFAETLSDRALAKAKGEAE